MMTQMKKKLKRQLRKSLLTILKIKNMINILLRISLKNSRMSIIPLKTAMSTTSLESMISIGKMSRRNRTRRNKNKRSRSRMKKNKRRSIGKNKGESMV